MKRFFRAGLIFILIVLLSACGKETSKGPKLRNPEAKYVGDYENDELYSLIKDIECSTDPEKLCKLLKDIYGQDFIYEKLKQGPEKAYCFEENINLVIFPTINGVYKMRKDFFAIPDVYFVYQEFDDGEGTIVSEEPTFIIDEYGSYLVDKYEYFIGELTNKEMLNVESWSILDLYMCKRGFIDDNEMKVPLYQWVDRMDFYNEFENIASNYIDVKHSNNKIEDSNSKEENIEEDDSDLKSENTYGVKADSYYEESLNWTEEELSDTKKDAEKIILSQEIISLDFIYYEQPEDMINVVHKITGIAKNSSSETISYYNMVFQTDDGAIWNISSAIDKEISPGEEFEVSGIPILPGVYLTDENKNTSVPVSSQVTLSNSKKTIIGYDFSSEKIYLFGRPIESYIGQPK